MKKENLAAFAGIPRPARESFGFLADIRKPLSYHFREGGGCPPGKTAGCMENGASVRIDFPRNDDFPETAFLSLHRVLKAKRIEEKEDAYPLYFRQDASLGKEAFHIRCTPERTVVDASDADGLRRAVYFLEDRICEAEGRSVTEGEWTRKAFVHHRISRCFFGPTNRPPFYIDELANDMDYYPDEYLNKLAHEGINGLWLTVYFKDIPSSFFPGRGADSEKRFAKLRKTAEKCARYGIRIYVFLSEPKLFGDAPFSIPEKEALSYPDLIRAHYPPFGFFCTSSEVGMKYLQECMGTLFREVPILGGVINIMLGEDNGSCVAHSVVEAYPAPGEICPVCSKRDHADIFAELASMFTRTIRRYNPDAEYIGWLYAPVVHEDSAFRRKLLHIAEKWPDDATLMYNFESGGTVMQKGKKRIVFDYSLAFPGPSGLFAEAAELAPHLGAKLQVGCSHEDASVPFIPVPENLYEKYRFMHGHHVAAVMQCWYFGNYPGLMNKAAGELSFEPFPADPVAFLEMLARPWWGKDARIAAEAWHDFSAAYCCFPANLLFEWYGPLHQSIVAPLYLFPEDSPLSPSWILDEFSGVCGDRVGECLGYHHTLAEALELCFDMSRMWQAGLEKLEKLRSSYLDDPPRLEDMDLAQAIGLQIKSTCNFLHFYQLREDMIYYKNDHLAQMREIVLDEIRHTERMTVLCERDSRLGYHSEAEGYLFYPAKLRARVKLLQELLETDFPKFRMDDPVLDSYTGRVCSGISAVIFRKGGMLEEKHDMGNGAFWQACYDEQHLWIVIGGIRDQDVTFVLEPCRLWTPFRIISRADGSRMVPNGIFRQEPEIGFHRGEDEIRMRIPLSLFEGFRRKGFPMRMNIWGNSFFWVEPKPWRGRLQHGNFNPSQCGWLIFESERA